jgi:hypothetical protein
VADGEIWQTTVGPPRGRRLPVSVARTETGELDVTVEGEKIRFAAAPPPIAATPPVAKLRYLGAYSGATCLRKHAKVRQLWLWRDGGRLYAVGIIATLIAGRIADFVSPVVLGEGRPDGATWIFDGRRHGHGWTATVALDSPGAPTLTLDHARLPSERLALHRPAIFGDDVIDLAPLTGKPAWDRWFATVLVGHFSSAQIPVCPDKGG